jgi:hypothetical protein
MLDVIIAELWGHVFNDWLQKLFHPPKPWVHKLENRLWGA